MYVDASARFHTLLPIYPDALFFFLFHWCQYLLGARSYLSPPSLFHLDMRASGHDTHELGVDGVVIIGTSDVQIGTVGLWAVRSCRRHRLHYLTRFAYVTVLVMTKLELPGSTCS